jgi:hypothetical protein
MERQEALDLLKENIRLTDAQVKEIYQACVADLKSYRTDGVGEMLVSLKNNLKDHGMMQDAIDVAALDCMIVRAFRLNMHSWRGRIYAREALRIYENYASSELAGKEAEAICQALAALGQDISSFMDFEDAARAYGAADRLALDAGLPLALAAGFKQKELINLVYDRTDPSFLPTKEELESTYKDVSALPISALEGRGYLKHDPVEASEEFQKAYDEVMEEAYAEIDKKTTTTPQERWAIIKEAFKKRGIDWKDPGEMNPDMMFR